MNKTQLQKLLKLGETTEIEYKTNIPKENVTSRLICAFSNTNGGIIIFGVDDKGTIIGVNEKNIDEKQRDIVSACDAIKPKPAIEINIKEIDKKKLIVVSVQKAITRSFYTYKGALYVRIGSKVRRLEAEDQMRFLRNKQIFEFDESFISEVSIDEIDIEKVEAYLQKRGLPNYLLTHSVEEFLLSNSLAKKIDNNVLIKNAAFVLLGKDPARYYPQIEFKLVKFAGYEPIDIVDYKLLRTDLLTQIEMAIGFVSSNIKTALKIEGNLRHKKIPEYPMEVVREAIINAVVHRDYFSKDSIQLSIFRGRIELISPGGLPRNMHKELFGTVSVRRNSLIYQIFKDVQYIEGLGTGIPKIKKGMIRNSLPEPEFKIYDNFFKLILYSEAKEEKPVSIDIDIKKLNKRQRKSIEYLKKHEYIKSKDYSELFKISRTSANVDLKVLVDMGIIRKFGKFRGVYYELND